MQTIVSSKKQGTPLIEAVIRWSPPGARIPFWTFALRKDKFWTRSRLDQGDHDVGEKKSGEVYGSHTENASAIDLA